VISVVIYTGGELNSFQRNSPPFAQDYLTGRTAQDT